MIFWHFAQSFFIKNYPSPYISIYNIIRQSWQTAWIFLWWKYIRTAMRRWYHDLPHLRHGTAGRCTRLSHLRHQTSHTAAGTTQKHTKRPQNLFQNPYDKFLHCRTLLTHRTLASISVIFLLLWHKKIPTAVSNCSRDFLWATCLTCNYKYIFTF